MTRLFAFILILLASSNFSQAQEQITHLFPEVGDIGSSPSQFIEYNNLLIFSAWTKDYGTELWITNGIEPPYLLKDINPGGNFGISTDFKDGAVFLNGLLYFVAFTNISGYQIWSTDGTENGTFQITNLVDTRIYDLTLVGNEIYFLNHQSESVEVWKSDGTDLGTILIQDNVPKLGPRSVYEGTVNSLFFFTFKMQNQFLTWRSDGTEDGTFTAIPKLDPYIINSNYQSTPPEFVPYKNELYVVAKSDLFDGNPKTTGILKTDGLVDGVQPIKNMFEGYVDFSDVIEINNKLYFSFFSTYANNLTIWESDGTEAGTIKIYDETVPLNYTPSTLNSDGPNLIFLAPNNSENYTLAALDTQDYHVTGITEIPNNSNPTNSRGENPTILAKVNDNMFHIQFHLNGEVYREAWITDLTAENTRNIEMLNGVAPIKNFQEYYYFTHESNSSGEELWRTNLSFDSHALFANICTYKSALLDPKYEKVGNKIFYDYGDVWAYDHNSNTNTLLNKLGESNPRNFTAMGNDLYYFGNTISGTKVFRADGTFEGTIAMNHLDSNIKTLIKPGIITFNDNIYYFVSSKDTDLSQYQNHLAKYNGNEFELVKAIGPPTINHGGTYGPQKIVTSENYLYFTVKPSWNIVELWRGDGTDAGTVKIKAFEEINDLTTVGDNVFLSVNGLHDLWFSDGTPEGTKEITSVPFIQQSNYNNTGMVALKDKLVFVASTFKSGTEIWVSDGTAEGTYQIKDIYEGEQNGADSNLGVFDHTILNDIIYFSANDGIHGNELWRTDGTTEGTYLVKDINDDKYSYPSYFTNDSERVYFSAFTSQNGQELWTSDGTDFGTYQLFDLKEGVFSSDPTSINFIEDYVYFHAVTDTEGKQLWRYDKKGDIDADGVINILDRCQDTPPGTLVNSNGCSLSSFPVDNFAILTTSATCVSKNNGSIEITAKELLDYSVTLTGENLSQTKEFNKTILFSDLAAGAYDLCISVYAGNYSETCFVLQITEPEALSVSSKINSLDNTINLNLSGSKDYFISLNDEVYHTSNNEITLALSANSNKLSVVTDKTCQGTFEKNIILSPTPLIYPNPINDGDLHITIGETETDYLTLSLYTLNGKMIMREPSKVDNKEVIFNVDGLKKGIYLLTLKARQSVIVHKLIKN